MEWDRKRFDIDTDVLIEAGGYALLAARDRAEDNGGMDNVDFAYNRSNFRLNEGDSIFLENSSTTIDSISYLPSIGYPEEPGTSMMLASLDEEDNDTASYWCTSTSSFGAGDLGTPGTENDPCTLAIGSSLNVSDLLEGDLIISEIMHDPTMVPDYRGEWFEIYNDSGSDINLNGLVVTGESTEAFSVDEDVIVLAGSYALFAVRHEYNGNIGTVDFVYPRSSFKLDLGSNRNAQHPTRRGD